MISTRIHKLALAAALLAGTALVAGCGGSDEATTTTGLCPDKEGVLF